MSDKRSVGESSRRSYIKQIGLGGLVTGLAGCTSGGSSDGGGSDGGGGDGGDGGDGTDTSNSGDGSTDTDSSDGSSDVFRGGNLRVAIGPEINTLSPVMTKTVFPQRWGIKMFYSTLTRLTPDLEVYGDLAEDWTAEEGGKVWTFSLRDAQFHQGGEVTASDVKASFDTVYDDDVGSPGKGTMGDIQSVEAVDDKTVRFNLAGANADFAKLVAKVWGSVVPEDIVTDPERRKELGSQEFGSGPFVLEEFSPGDQTVGTAFDDYFREGMDGEPLPYVDKFTQKTLTEPSARVNQLRNETVDIIWNPDTDQVPRLREIDGVNVQIAGGGSFNTLIMDVETEPFNDERVRQAFMLATDRQAIIQSVVSGLGKPGQDTPIGPAYQFYADSVGVRDQDIEKAKSLLAEAGYSDGLNLTEDFDIQLPLSSVYGMADTGIIMKEQLKQIGVSVEVTQSSYSDWITNVWRKRPFYTISYGMRISGPNWMKQLLHSNGGWNSETNYSNEELDELIDKAISSTDTEERRQLMESAQQIVHDKGPMVVPYYDSAPGASNKYVHNYDLNPLTFLFYADEYMLGPNAPTRN
jgi:peptide/nickel transport system substrate-binding protein